MGLCESVCFGVGLFCFRVRCTTSRLLFMTPLQSHFTVVVICMHHILSVAFPHSPRRCVPPEQLAPAIQTLAQPLLNPIQATTHQFTPSLGGAGSETTLAAQLPLFDRLATLFESLPQQHVPAASILEQAWPSLDVAMLRAGQDSSAIERLCRYMGCVLGEGGFYRFLPTPFICATLYLRLAASLISSRVPLPISPSPQTHTHAGCSVMPSRRQTRRVARCCVCCWTPCLAGSNRYVLRRGGCS